MSSAGNTQPLCPVWSVSGCVFSAPDPRQSKYKSSGLRQDQGGPFASRMPGTSEPISLLCQSSTTTERAGFEPAMEFNPHTRLAGECLQPLGHLSWRSSHQCKAWLAARERGSPRSRLVPDPRPPSSSNASAPSIKWCPTAVLPHTRTPTASRYSSSKRACSAPPRSHSSQSSSSTASSSASRPALSRVRARRDGRP